MSFAAWMAPGDVLDSAEVSITSSENGGTSYFDQIVSFTQSGCIGNEFGYNVCTETASFNGPALNSGTYWLNLQNASSAAGDPIYWDENSGPSQASESTVGTIPSESFTILGSSTTSTTTSIYQAPCPWRQSGFYDLHDFDLETAASGVAVGPAGRLYGALANAGNHGAGLLYDLAQTAASWFLSPLYSFLGGSNGSSPNSVIGPGGALYGAAESEIQTCGPSGNYNCGLIYKATPGPSACAAGLCSWNETTMARLVSTPSAGCLASRTAPARPLSGAGGEDVGVRVAAGPSGQAAKPTHISRTCTRQDASRPAASQ
jgi:hypothetical protein